MSKIIIPYVKTEGHQCAYNQKTGSELWTIDDLIDDANEELIDNIKDIKKLQLEKQALQETVLEQEKYRQSIEREHKERISRLQKENEDLRKIARGLREYQDNESVDEIPMSIMDILCANKATIDRLLTTEGEE